MSLMTVAQAAERLDVSPRRVQHLVAGGQLRQLARGVVDATSVERLLAVRGRSHTRAWSSATAWGAVALLSGADAGWMEESQRSRLRARLRVICASRLVERTRERAAVTRYAAHPATGGRLTGELICASADAGALGLADTTRIDGYLTVEASRGVVARHGLIPDDDGHVALRATGMDLSVVRGISEAGSVLAGLDLAESLDVRERRAGRDILVQALRMFRG